MTFDDIPTLLIPGWSENGTDVTFPIASVPQLNADEADAANGDSRKIIYALMERFYAWYNDFDPKPGKLAISRSQAVTESGDIIRTYTVRVTTTPSGIEVANEE